MSILINTIRWIIFIPISLILLGLVQTGLAYSIFLIEELHLSMFLLMFGLFVFGSIIWFVFQMISAFIAMLAVFICPDKKTGGVVFAILTFLSFLIMIIRLWTIQQNYNGNVVVFCLIMSIIYIGIGFVMIGAAISTNEISV